ncbi:hypothetical protein QF049_004382 [Paenibacillus sp. W4I10]|uniref:hypothetical protein n=1 Tax=Paenibacillus sp. W4I10 TaxID=3042298 RepID=UPI00277F70AB|nr:hypothetical protein [Paenibacillus sp. W4I10]MDQ0723121.1 hypothetical protein [Paenibacillus sp. W4I10]
MWNVCGEYTWCLPAHLGTGEVGQVNGNIDLFAAETVHMLAEIVTIHAERLDRLVIERIRFEAERRIFIPLYREQRKFHWQTADHNWSAVCGGCCGMAALLLLEDESTLQESISHTVSCMNAFLSGYGEDGGCAEGIGYWVYGFGYFTYYAEMLRQYSEGELDLLTGSKNNSYRSLPAASSSVRRNIRELFGQCRAGRHSFRTTLSARVPGWVAGGSAASYSTPYR